MSLPLSRQIPSLKTPARTFISNNTFKQQESINQVHHLFDEMPHKDLRSLNALLATTVREGKLRASWLFFSHMHRTCSYLDSYSFTPVIRACSTLSDPIRGSQVHGLVIKTGSESETVIATALIDMYSNCDCLGDSFRVFRDMKFKDVVAWNAMLTTFLHHGLSRDALCVFEEMQKDWVEFSGFTLCSLLKACASLKTFRLGKQVHGLVIVMGCDLLVLGTALIDFYSSFGLIEEAVKVFGNLNDRKDNVIYNSLVAGCVRNHEYDLAFSIVRKMKPNVIALTSALVACSEYSDLSIGKQIHCVAIRFGFKLDTQLCNTLLDMYAKCGEISLARLVFDQICEKNVVSWTSIIDAYGSHGRGVEAVELFKKMEEGPGVCPNPVTFLAVLSACAHSGLVELGRECFVSMRQKYRFVPAPEHYACFIDLLGRAGQIEEAWDLFHYMSEKGTKPTGTVWAALLNACRVNLDVVRGEFAAKHLFELEPTKPENYVSLSNFYAAVEKWDCVEELRSIMKHKRLKKEAGNSWITVACCNGDDVDIAIQEK